MEYFDVLNEKEDKLGYTKKRGDNLESNEYNYGVEVWFINNNKILMTKRSKEKSHPGQWEVPGGCSQAGETILQTVIREMQEEINQKITQKDIEFVDTYLYKHQFVKIYKSIKTLDLNTVKLQKEEVSDIAFVSKEEFEEMKSKDLIVPSVLDRFYFIKDKLTEIDW